MYSEVKSQSQNCRSFNNYFKKFQNEIPARLQSSVHAILKESWLMSLMCQIDWFFIVRLAKRKTALLDHFIEKCYFLRAVTLFIPLKVTRAHKQEAAPQDAVKKLTCQYFLLRAPFPCGIRWSYDHYDALLHQRHQSKPSGWALIGSAH